LAGIVAGARGGFLAICSGFLIKTRFGASIAFNLGNSSGRGASLWHAMPPFTMRALIIIAARSADFYFCICHLQEVARMTSVHTGRRHVLPITTRTRGIPLTEPLQNVARGCIAVALGRLAPRVRRVFVWLEDLNGPRGGRDRRCRIDVHLTSGGRVVVSDVAATEYQAIGRAASRMRIAIDRRIKKRRTRRRSTRRPLLHGAAALEV
jgi:hypothetical protein